MRIFTLGCSGSITGNLRTTSYLVDDDILIDAGTGAGDLSLERAMAVNTVFLTHAHLDHTCMLPMLADAVGNFRDFPLTVFALQETIDSLRANLLNGALWPDYTALPSPDSPYIHFLPIAAGETVTLAGRKITALPAKHTIPCVGYRVDNGDASWVYCGDTTLHEEFWQNLNRIPNLKHLLIETTFLDANQEAAAHAGHMTAKLVSQGLHMLQHPTEVHIVHMEAGREAAIMQEVQEAAGAFKPTPLQHGHVFEL